MMYFYTQVKLSITHSNKGMMYLYTQVKLSITHSLKQRDDVLIYTSQAVYVGVNSVKTEKAGINKL